MNKYVSGMKTKRAVQMGVLFGVALGLSLVLTGTLYAQQSAQVVDVTGSSAAVKEIRVESQGFVYTPREIRVNQGDRIRLTYHNGGGFHDWVLDEFDAKTRRISANQSETIEFIADRAGDFEFYCSVGNHRAQGMVGRFVVVAR